MTVFYHIIQHTLFELFAVPAQQIHNPIGKGQRRCGAAAGNQIPIDHDNFLPVIGFGKKIGVLFTGVRGMGTPLQNPGLLQHDRGCANRADILLFCVKLLHQPDDRRIAPQIRRSGKAARKNRDTDPTPT